MGRAEYDWRSYWKNTILNLLWKEEASKTGGVEDPQKNRIWKSYGTMSSRRPWKTTSETLWEYTFLGHGLHYKKREAGAEAEAEAEADVGREDD